MLDLSGEDFKVTLVNILKDIVEKVDNMHKWVTFGK